jgi:hypothetical protein
MKLVTIDLLYAIDTMPLRNRLFFSFLLASLFLSTAGLANSTCEDSFQAADSAARRSVLPPIDNAAVFITRDWWLKDYALELEPVLNLSPVDALEFVVRARIRPYELQTALGEGIGQHWSGTTRLDLARRISSAVTAAPDHFSGSGKYKVDEIKRLINALQQPSRLSINETIRAIQGLGYSSSIAPSNCESASAVCQRNFGLFLSEHRLCASEKTLSRACRGAWAIGIQLVENWIGVVL